MHGENGNLRLRAGVNRLIEHRWLTVAKMNKGRLHAGGKGRVLEAAIGTVSATALGSALRHGHWVLPPIGAAVPVSTLCNRVGRNRKAQRSKGSHCCGKVAYSHVRNPFLIAGCRYSLVQQRSLNSSTNHTKQGHDQGKR